MTNSHSSDTTEKTWGNISLRDKALRLLEKSEASTGSIIDSSKILDYLDLTYCEFTPDRNNQMVLGAIDHNSKRILINSELSDEEKHFTLAHELGHAILHPNQNMVDFRVSKSQPEPRTAKEREANVFAYELVLPITSFIDACKHFDFDISKIATHFLVSSQRVRDRIAFLDKQVEQGKIKAYR